MALQYVNVPEKNLSLGIDARSSENQIPEGFVKDLLNADVVEGRVRKRPGYQGHSGNLPVRATSMEYNDTANTVTFSLDSSISMEQVSSSPLVIYGKSSIFSSGPYVSTGSSGTYYSKFTVPTRKLITAPSGTLSIPANEHGLGSTDNFCKVVESTSFSNNSYTKVLTDAIRQDESSFDIEIDYTTFEDKEVFVYYYSPSGISGESYAATLTKTVTGTETFSIPTATHNLANFNIICQVQQDIGSEKLQVVPDTFIVAPNGDVSVTLDSATGTVYRIVLSSAPISNEVSGVVAGLSSGTVTISSPVSPWLFYGIYLEQTPNGNKELVYPDTIDYDSATNEITLSFTNMAPVARNFIVFYQYGDIRSNRLTVSDVRVDTSGTDSAPQITIWGLDHSEIYASSNEREGWVNHIDSYRRSGEQRLVSGLGGNLYASRTYNEAASTYLYNSLFPNLFARTNSDKILGPVFWNTGETPARTRGYITGTDSGTNWASISSVEYDISNDWTKYTISIPNKQILDSSGTPTSLASVISVGGNTNDYLTVSNMSYARHNGTFEIKQVQDGTNEIFVWVENTSNTEDYDDLNTSGLAGIFSDQLEWTATSSFIENDSINSVSLGSSSFTVYSSQGSVSVVSNQVSLMSVPGGLLFSGQRKSSVIPLRSENPAGTPNADNLVRGDMLSYPGIDRLLRILDINPDSPRTVSITSSTGTATVTLGSGDTSFLRNGMCVLLTNAGVYSGKQVITDIPSSSSFSFASEETVSVTGAILVGKTITIDEELTWSDTSADTNAVTVVSRWIPVEAPEDSFNLTRKTYTSHFDSETYTSQAFLRSTIVQDNMYLTNQSDTVNKMDGNNIYRAGLPSWQPGLFITQDTGATAKVVTDNRTLAYSARVAAEGKLTITSAGVNVIPVGQKVKLAGSSQTYTIRQYENDGTDYYVFVDRALDAGVSATGNISEIAVFRYYYRLNAVDANDNVVASAATGYQDHVIEMTANAAINHKLIGLPVFDNYDYDRLEVQIYRTQRDLPAPFYLITTLQLNFDNTTGYVEFTDTFADSDLTQLDLVQSALLGAELGINWQEPLRAKYVTSLGNKLVLGNLKDYPELDIQLFGPANLANSDFAGDTFLFRKDITDTGTTTNMVDRVKYEWKNGFTGDVSNFTIGTNEFSFDTSVNTSANPGDWIYLTYATVATSGRVLTYSGWWQIASVSSATVTVNLEGAASATAYPDKYVIATDPTDVPILLGTDGNMGMFNGDSFDTFDAMRRFSMALNASMRQTDTTITGYSTFVPWMQARGGNDVASSGRVIIRSRDVIETISTFSGYSVYINSIARTTGTQVSATTRVYPSRIAVSYENYPEIFDSPTVTLDTDSSSVIDINSADGQAITGIIPFFGEAAFGAAQQSAILVVFKENSIYLVDLNEKAAGRNAVQRIETEGLGCTFPYSIAVTKNGIIFANESGLYCLRRNQSIQYIGRYMERQWTERVTLLDPEVVHGHHYGVGRSYKVSVPVDSATSPSEVFVYNHTGEQEGQAGAWGRYDNHTAIGWANLAQDAFFASTNGRVYSIRRTGTSSDYRDDNEGILFSLETRPNDFGNSGIRKVLDKIVVHYRSGANNTGTSVGTSEDLLQEYQPITPPKLNTQSPSNGIGDQVGRDIDTIAHSVGRRKGVYFSVQIQNSTIDEKIEVAGIDYSVAGLAVNGIKVNG